MEDDPRLEENDKVLCAISYVFWPFAPLLLLTPRKDLPFVRYHAMQSFLMGASALLIYAIGWLLYYFCARAQPGRPDLVWGLLPHLVNRGDRDGRGRLGLQLFFSYKAWYRSGDRVPVAGGSGSTTGFARRQGVICVKASVSVAAGSVSSKASRSGLPAHAAVGPGLSFENTGDPIHTSRPTAPTHTTRTSSDRRGG